jgi:beta-N-acetylhexosaminidase
VIEHDGQRLRDADLAPFRAAIAAGADAVMSSHAAYPALTGRRDLPGTVAEAVLTRLLRDELGFAGVAITDALDMGALAQGAGQVVEAIAALCAGADLLLATTARGMAERLAEGLGVAASRGLLDGERLAASAERIAQLAALLAAAPRPDLDVVGCAAHGELASELAARALTLVRDPARVLPLGIDGPVLAVMPQPFDRTPADTSSSVEPALAAALRGHGWEVREHVGAADPDAAEIAAVRRLAEGAAAVVVGTIDAFAFPGQVAMVEALAATGLPVVTVSLRMPDVHALPAGTTHVCTYAIHRPSLDALAAALRGTAGFPGRLPVALPAPVGGAA